MPPTALLSVLSQGLCIKYAPGIRRHHLGFVNMFGSCHQCGKYLHIACIQADGDGGREMELDEFLRFVEGQKHLGGADTDDTDTVEAFVALGGKV